MRAMSRSQYESNRMVRSTSPAAAKLVPLPTKSEPKPRGQVVDVAPGNHQKRDDAKYLAETSNTVQRETRARETTAFYGTAAPRTTSTLATLPNKAAPPIPEQKRGNHGRGDDERVAAAARNSSTRPTEKPVLKKRDLLALSSPDQTGAGVSASNLLAKKSAVGGASLMPDATPVEGGPDQSASEGREGSDVTTHAEPSNAVQGPTAGAAPNDALRDVPIGDGTFLNTKEWKFAGFMNRVKQSVSAHWDPRAVSERQHLVATGTDRTTVLQVVLKADGAIAGIKVVKGAGAESLDSEAVAAFERSAPFPNPPRGLVEEDGHIRFNFAFIIESGGFADMRGFRWRP